MTNQTSGSRGSRRGDRPPRVLVVFHEEVLGGASRAVLKLVPFLEEAGWAFSFWAPTSGKLSTALDESGYRFCGEPRLLRYSRQTLKMPPGAMTRLRSVPPYLRHFAHFLRSEAPTLVHANSLLSLPEALVARANGYPTLLHAHEVLPSGSKAVLTGMLARSAHTVLCPSVAAQSALRRAGVSSLVVNNGTALAPAIDRDGAAKKRLVVGTVGTISKGKGSDVFLSAVRAVKAHRPDIEFRMIGPLAAGPERAWAQRLADRAGQDGVIIGVRDDIFGELADWDLFVLPSRQDAFPLAVLEAMSAGLPIVATGVGGIPEQLGVDAGVLVNPDDPEALAAAIQMLASQPHVRAEMGAAGRGRVEREFTLEAQAAKVDRAYHLTVTTASRSKFTMRVASRSGKASTCSRGSAGRGTAASTAVGVPEDRTQT